MNALERHRGHFYNWYDTQSLKPLMPMYVSSVDSGNLSASLLTLRAGLLALPDEKLLGRRLFDGLADTAMILADVAGERIPTEFARFNNEMASMSSSTSDETLWAVWQGLERLAMFAGEVVRSFKSAPESEETWWARALAEQCQAAVDELTLLAPWAGPLPPFHAMEQALDAFPCLRQIPTLRRLACLDDDVLPLIGEKQRLSETPKGKQQLDDLRGLKQLDKLRGLIKESSRRARERIAIFEDLARCCGELAENMEYAFLYDPTRHLLSIGYNVSENRRDESYYDLLASEARLSSFVAIAQGQLPQESWFALGRLLTDCGGRADSSFLERLHV